MWNIEEIKKDVRSNLSESRYNHSLRVMEEAKKLAERYHGDLEKVTVCALTHDMCKEYTKEENEKFIEKYHLSKDLLNVENRNVLHGVLASILVKEKYNFTNDMVRAIKYHTTGYPKMDLLAKIIYLADKIEKCKNYPGIEEERKLAYQDIDKAIILCLNNSIRHLKEKNEVINSKVYETLDSLVNSHN